RELINEICERLGKDKSITGIDLLDEIDELTDLERWVYFELPNLFEDNDVMREVVIESLKEWTE
ncbi:MAG: hypothetical protein GQ582_00070, partial [Methyloprofundus sp.]|nr:hypothetical protein [Methyloprofundus sp.]